MRIKPSTNEIYHIYNRGVEKRKIFLDEKDHIRFIHDLYEFNDTAPTINMGYYFKRNRQSNSIEVGLRYIKKEKVPRNFFVEILSFCLMPNHYHLMVRQLVDSGITEFMRKLGAGYTNYFNEKYERVGSLFQGKYKSALIKTDAHFIHLPYYIHSNPIDLIIPNWKSNKIRDCKKIHASLNNYRWSSHLDYNGIKNFPSVTQREFLTEYFGSHQKYSERFDNWLKEMDLGLLENIIIE